MFQSLFESSAEAIWLYDLHSGLLTDCNQAAVELMGAENRQQLVPSRPEHLSRPIQPDGSNSTKEIIAVVRKQKTHRFEWVLRRLLLSSSRGKRLMKSLRGQAAGIRTGGETGNKTEVGNFLEPP